MNENIKVIQVKDKYMEFNALDDVEQAKLTFEQRWGYPPEYAKIDGWRLCVGPVKEEL